MRTASDAACAVGRSKRTYSRNRLEYDLDSQAAGVGVSSRVETRRGKKDRVKVRAFVRAVRKMVGTWSRNGDNAENESQNLHPSRKERV